MKNDINSVLEEELKENSKYDLQPIKNNNSDEIILFELSSENVKKVEAMLRYNSYYVQFGSKLSTPKAVFASVQCELDKICDDININMANDKQYEYSSTHYIKIFKYLYDDNSAASDEDKKKYYEALIYIILRKINSENRTRVSLKLIDEISKEICKKYSVKDVNSFIDVLKEPSLEADYSKRKYELIEIISYKYEVEGIKKAFHLSLASKFCHFFAFYFFDEPKYRDAFSIYDQVVKDNLENYYNVYGCDKDSKIDNYHYDINKNYGNKYTMVDIYRDYQKIIDKILEKNDYKISRNGFDHIVWYTSKGRQ